MANILRKFIDLLPEQDQRNIGTVASINLTAGTSTLTTLSGGAVTVLGTSVAVGQKAFFKGGRIEGSAPNLPSYEIEV